MNRILLISILLLIYGDTFSQDENKNYGNAAVVQVADVEEVGKGKEGFEMFHQESIKDVKEEAKADSKLYTTKIDKADFTYHIPESDIVIQRSDKKAKYFIINKSNGKVENTFKTDFFYKYDYERFGSCNQTVISPDNKYLIDMRVNNPTSFKVYEIKKDGLLELYVIGDNQQLWLPEERNRRYNYIGTHKIEFSDDLNKIYFMGNYQNAVGYQKASHFFIFDLKTGNNIFTSKELGLHQYEFLTQSKRRYCYNEKQQKLYYWSGESHYSYMSDKKEVRWLRIYDIATETFTDNVLSVRQGGIIDQSDDGRYLFIQDYKKLYKIDLELTKEEAQPLMAKAMEWQKAVTKDPYSKKKLPEIKLASSSSSSSSTNNYATVLLKKGPIAVTATDMGSCTGSSADREVFKVCYSIKGVYNWSKSAYETYLNRLNNVKSSANKYAWGVTKATLDYYYKGGWNGGNDNIGLYGERLEEVGVPSEYGNTIPELAKYCMGIASVSTSSKMTLQEYSKQIQEGIKSDKDKALKHSTDLYNQKISRDIKQGKKTGEFMEDPPK